MFYYRILGWTVEIYEHYSFTSSRIHAARAMEVPRSSPRCEPQIRRRDICALMAGSMVLSIEIRCTLWQDPLDSYSVIIDYYMFGCVYHIRYIIYYNIYIYNMFGTIELQFLQPWLCPVGPRGWPSWIPEPGGVSAGSKKWQCDGWQEKIHGRDLVYFGERALMLRGRGAVFGGHVHIGPRWVPRLLTSSSCDLMIPIIVPIIMSELCIHIYIYIHICILYTHTHLYV